MVAERENVVTVRLSRDEHQMVKAMAGANGVSLSDAVRMAVRRAHAEMFGAMKPKTKR
jgi:hypothetical protein